MSTPFFSTLDQIHRLRIEATEWLRTPFAAHAHLKRAGADCVGLVAGIYLALGALKEYQPGKYSLDEGEHGETSKVLAWFANRPGFTRIDPSSGGTSSTSPQSKTPQSAPQPGDTLCFRLAGVEHHVGLMLDAGDFIHVMPRRYAVISNLRESFYSRRLTAIFRPIV